MRAGGRDGRKAPEGSLACPVYVSAARTSSLSTAENGQGLLNTAVSGFPLGDPL